MNNDHDSIKPVLSQTQKDLYFTDPNYELSGTLSGKTAAGQRTFRKKAWFSQKMNKQGRFLQFTIIGVISLIGFGVGLKFLKIPPKAQALRLLIQYGYRGPYHDLQVVDLKLREAHNPDSEVLAADITVFNFEKHFVDGKPIQINLKQNLQPKLTQHLVECCNSPIAPNSSHIVRTMVKNVSTSVQTIEASVIQTK